MPSPTELIERQQELHELVASAPADQRDFIDRITNSQLDANEIHEYLSDVDCSGSRVR